MALIEGFLQQSHKKGVLKFCFKNTNSILARFKSFFKIPRLPAADTPFFKGGFIKWKEFFILQLFSKMLVG